MKVSKKAYYGLRAVITLAQSGQPLSTHAIATAQVLPEDYLEKILQMLRRARLVEAKKGVNGGYVLARPIKEISVWDILSVLDGPARIQTPVTKGALPCLRVSHCQTNQVWRTLEDQIETTLSSLTLDHIIHHPLH